MEMKKPIIVLHDCDSFDELSDACKEAFAAADNEARPDGGDPIVPSIVIHNGATEIGVIIYRNEAVIDYDGI